MASLDSRTFSPVKLRRTILDMAFYGGTVHIGCAFSLVEILAVLYRSFLKYPGNEPEAQGRDYLALSKGHGVMAQYACMRELGWLSDDDIKGYFSDGSTLKGLSDSRIPGLEVTSGSLGHGFSVGVGLSLAARLKGSGQKTYAIVGDGELNEGPIWEGAMFASQHKLADFMMIIDRNGFQAMGATDEVLDLSPIEGKLASFGFEVAEVDGHDEKALQATITSLWSSESDRPKAIVAKTVKGKGVSFMENNNAWHYSRLNKETYAAAIAELGGLS